MPVALPDWDASITGPRVASTLSPEKRSWKNWSLSCLLLPGMFPAASGSTPPARALPLSLPMLFDRFVSVKSSCCFPAEPFPQSPILLCTNTCRFPIAKTNATISLPQLPSPFTHRWRTNGPFPTVETGTPARNTEGPCSASARTSKVEHVTEGVWEPPWEDGMRCHVVSDPTDVSILLSLENLSGARGVTERGIVRGMGFTRSPSCASFSTH
mmetsp:Transcript_511/g.722  ORF Transcript_511/g.722 Transcript_511/m.722 type:complete len:213 (-) Transcript_511:1501-2139(-)